MSLADIYDEYLVRTARGKKRDPLRLFVTDVGKCQRQVALRMLGAERKPITPGQRAMWDLAEYIEENLMRALDAKDLLLEYQAPVDISDRENWGGRLDLVWLNGTKVQIREVKTVRSNAFNYSDRPKKEHVYQATIYDHYYDYEWAAEEFPCVDGHLPPIIDYWDRGGSNPPEEHELAPDFEVVRPLMDELDAVRDALPELPKMMPREFKLAGYSTQLKRVPSYQCSYCDFQGVSCHPDVSEEVWMERAEDPKTKKRSGRWTLKQKADTALIVDWAQAQGRDVILADLDLAVVL